MTRDPNDAQRDHDPRAPWNQPDDDTPTPDLPELVLDGVTYCRVAGNIPEGIGACTGCAFYEEENAYCRLDDYFVDGVSDSHMDVCCATKTIFIKKP